MKQPVSEYTQIEKIEKDNETYTIYFYHSWLAKLFGLKQEIRRFKYYKDYSVGYPIYIDEYGNEYYPAHSVCKELDKYERSLNF